MIVLSDSMKKSLEEFITQLAEKDNEEYVPAIEDIIDALASMLGSRDTSRSAMLLTHSDKGFGCFAVCPSAVHAVALLYAGMSAIKRADTCANMLPETETETVQ